TGLHQVLGDERLQPAKSTLLGLCHVIVQEHPGIRCRLVDIDGAIGSLATQTLDKLALELCAESPGPVVAHRNGHRWVRTFERVQSPAATTPVSGLREGGVYLITGGLGDLGRACAEFITRRVGAHLILVGRSASPERAARDGRTRALEAA